MRRLCALGALALIALTLVSSALAGGIYAGPWQWSAGQGAGSSFKGNWLENYFGTYGSGYDKTVTFIDNKSYGWHNTVRNKNGQTTTYPPYPGVYKPHCVANVSYFYGSCSAY
jgi:hypothetical protein